MSELINDCVLCLDNGSLIECCFTAPPGGGYSIYPWVGKCGLAPHTLTLFKTKIADFPILFKKRYPPPPPPGQHPSRWIVENTFSDKKILLLQLLVRKQHEYET